MRAKFQMRQRQLLQFIKFVIRLFHTQPVLRRRKFFQGWKISRSESADSAWFRTDGGEMTEDNWNNLLQACLGLRLAGDAIDEVDRIGNPIKGDMLMILLNAHHESYEFSLPTHRPGGECELLLDTHYPQGKPDQSIYVKGGGAYRIEQRSAVVFALKMKDSSADAN